MHRHFSTPQDEHGQAALETAILLIAFVIVASVFAFTILSAGASSTEKGKQAIEAGLEGVQSTMYVKGSVIAMGSSPYIDSVIFTVALMTGGTSVNLSDTAKEVAISYKDQDQFVNNVDWTLGWIVTKQANIADANDLLEAGELAEITVDLTALDPRLGTNTAFSLEIKPPKGAVLNINRTTPAGIQMVMSLN